MTDKINLNDKLLFGKGNHKKVYIDPTDSNRCIKVPFVIPDVDLEKELKYRRSRERRRLKSSMLPAYYGTVETNMGTGYVFERVRDFDGKTSQSFKDLFEKAAADSALLPFVEEMMQKCKAMLFQELIVTSNMEDGNFVLQRISEKEYTIRIIDNIGSPVFFPLAYYFDFFARKRTDKYWKRFLNNLQRWHPTVMTDGLKNKLL